MATDCTIDRRGNVLGGISLYKTPSQSADSFRPIARPRAKTYEAVTSWQRREMVDVSRVIAAGVPIIRSALITSGEFAVGDSWHIKSRSSNKAWGKQRDEWFNCTYAKNCNANGQMNDWHSTLRQLNWTRKVQADYGIVFDGQPSQDPVTLKRRDPTGKFKIIKFDRIATGLIGTGRGPGSVSVGSGLEECKELPRAWNYYSGSSGYSVWPGIYLINDASSPFDGYRIIDGVIVDANMTKVGYRITGFTEAGQPTYCDLPAAQIHFNFSAREDTDLIRGIPEIGSKIIPIMHLDDIQNLIEMAIKLASAMAVTRESTDGRPATSGVTFTKVQTTEVDDNGEETTRNVIQAVQDIFPGIIELATNNKEKISAVPFERPSLNEENFIRRVEKSILHDLWPRDLIYAEDSGRAGTRAIAVQANTISAWDQVCLGRDACWIANRATEFAMRAGFIPANDNLDDAYRQVFTLPAKFSVDEGNDLKGYFLSLNRCCISSGIICEMSGYLAEEIEEQREAEIMRRLDMARRISTKNPEFSVKEAYLLIDNSDQNISFAESVTPTDDNEEPGGTTPPNSEPKQPKKETAT